LLSFGAFLFFLDSRPLFRAHLLSDSSVDSFPSAVQLLFFPPFSCARSLFYPDFPLPSGSKTVTSSLGVLLPTSCRFLSVLCAIVPHLTYLLYLHSLPLNHTPSFFFRVAPCAHPFFFCRVFLCPSPFFATFLRFVLDVFFLSMSRFSLFYFTSSFFTPCLDTFFSLAGPPSSSSRTPPPTVSYTSSVLPHRWFLLSFFLVGFGFPCFLFICVHTSHPFMSHFSSPCPPPFRFMLPGFSCFFDSSLTASIFISQRAVLHVTHVLSAVVSSEDSPTSFVPPFSIPR